MPMLTSGVRPAQSLRLVPILFLLLNLHIVEADAQCCYYKLSMNDSYGDGWNGGYLSVFVNSVFEGNHNAVGFGSIDSFLVCNGDTLQLIYTSGNYESENTYQLNDAAWNLLFSDGPNPDTGSVFTVVGDCNAVAAPGSHPCVAIPIDTGQCIVASNVGFPHSGLNPNCANYQGPEVWFQALVPPSGAMAIGTDSGSINDSGLGVWTGSLCSNLVRVDCDDDAGPDYFSSLLLYDLPPGDTVYIQVFGYGGATGTFRLCVDALPIVTLDSSELPIVLIHTQNQAIVQNTKINCRMEMKYNGPGSITHITDSSNIYDGIIGIEIRGASSAGYPQHPYGLETRDSAFSNNNVALLDLPAENDWVLLSHYNDRSLLRNQLAFRLFGEMGNYSPRMRLCEVTIDSSYQGIYLFGEKIKRDNNRVHIAKLTPADSTGDELTGGYILQQNYWNANNSFLSNYSPIDHPGFDVHFVYEYPDADSMLPVQKAYIASYVDSLEDAFYGPNFADTATGYRKYLDVKSFIDYFIVNEVARNGDGFKKSVFFHKDKYSNGGKLKMGPIWDFDWAWKNLFGCSIFSVTDGSGWAHHINDCPTDNYSTGWYIRLLQDSTFNNELRCTYEYYRRTILDTTYLFGYMDSIQALVQNAQARHFARWPILGISGPAPEISAIATTYNAEIDTLKEWISIRLQWLDANIPGVCLLTSANENRGASGIRCYPNPMGSQFTVSTEAALLNKPYKIYDYTGREIRSGSLEQANTVINASDMPAGVYFLIVFDEDRQYSEKIIKRTSH